MLSRLLARARTLLPEHIQQGSPEQSRQASTVILFSFALALWGPIEGTMFWLLDLPLATMTCAVGTWTVLATILVLRRTGSVKLAGHWLALQLYLVVLGASIEVGGLDSSSVAWDASVPMFATILAGRRAGVLWLGLVVLKLSALGLASHLGVLGPSVLAPSVHGIYDFTVMAGIATLMTSLGWLYENEKNIALAAVEVEAGRARDAHAQSRRILDNVSDGLAMVDVDGVLQHERSATLERWFGVPAPHTPLWTWLEPFDARFATALELGWDQMRADILPVEIAIAQLPATLRSGEATYRAGYHPLTRGDALEQVLVTISDVSAELEASRSRRAHEDTMAVVARFGHDAQGCREFVSETQDAIDALHEIEDLQALRRVVHTLKGSCATFGMRGFADLLHRCEDRLGEGEPTDSIIDKVADYWSDIGPVVRPLVGDPEVVHISRDTLRAWTRELEDRHYASVREEVENRLTEPARLRLERFGTAARELALRLGKEPPHVSISDGGVRVDPRQWATTWAALGHLVRNCIDHGIECTAERIAAGKPATGRLTLRTRRVKGGIAVEVGDDGRGIDWERVRRAASAKGLRATTRDELLDALFADGVSTRERVTATSGRGVGMASIKSTVEASGGRIEVETAMGSGTLFRCVIPEHAPFVQDGSPSLHVH